MARPMVTTTTADQAQLDQQVMKNRIVQLQHDVHEMDKRRGETKSAGPYATAKKELLTLTKALNAVPQTGRPFFVVVDW